MDKLVAVIVPVYNAEQYLEKCIESILSENKVPIEIVLVDDGATDSSGRICDAFAAKDARIKVIHKENEGLMATWIRGVKESSAPFLFFVDSDDWLEEDVISTLAASLVPDKKQIVTGGFLIDRGEKGTRKERVGVAAGVYEGDALKTQIQNEVLGHEVRRVPLSRCMKLFSRELIEENLSFVDPSVRMGEDLTITVPAILDAERIVVLEGGPYYHYRYVTESMVHHYDAGLRENNVLLTKILQGVMEAKGIPQGAEAVKKEALFLWMLAMKNELRNEDEEDAIRNIRDICEKEKVKELLSLFETPFDIRTNRWIASMMRHPGTLRIKLLRALMRLKA